MTTILVKPHEDEKASPANEVAKALVKLGVIRADELDALPSLRAHLADQDEALKLAAGDRQRLGDLLTDASRLIDEQIDHALDEQARTHEKLGDVLVRLGYLTLTERDLIVEFQRYQAGAAPASDKLRLGRILVSTGEISEGQLSETLGRARSAGRRIGDELVAEGHLSPERLERALTLQRRLVVTALTAALFPASAIYTKQAKAADARGYMTITATVVDTMTMRAVYQATDLVITAEDVARGYVDVPAASRFEIGNKGPCVFEFRRTGTLFRSFRVTLPEGTAQFGAEGGTLLQKSRSAGVARVDVSYRFDLDPGVKPGTYRWPLSITILPM